VSVVYFIKFKGMWYMLRITVELVPYGIESVKRTLGVAEIINTGEGTSEIGEYTATIYDGGNTTDVWKSCTIRDFPPWDLLFRVLDKTIALRNKLGDTYTGYKKVAKMVPSKASKTHEK
jgi:hypothetical protein